MTILDKMHEAFWESRKDGFVNHPMEGVFKVVLEDMKAYRHPTNHLGNQNGPVKFPEALFAAYTRGVYEQEM